MPGPTTRFASTSARQTVETPADRVLRLEPPSTMRLIDGQLEIYRLDPGDQIREDALPVATRDLGGDALALDIPVPTEPGRWLLNVYARWQTGCAAGDGYADVLLVTS